MKNPCTNCVPPKRNARCHAECKEYLAWNKEHIEERDRIRSIKDREMDYLGVVIDDMLIDKKRKRIK